MNNLDVDGPDPKQGISMVWCDSDDDAIYQRVKRFDSEEYDKYDNTRDVMVHEADPLLLDDGYELPVLHIYYYTKEEPDREIHSVFTAWPVIVDWIQNG